MDRIKFCEKLSRLGKVTSRTGKSYHLVKVTKERVNFRRDHKQQIESISIDELYALYTQVGAITTTIAKGYISGRVQSPAVAIMDELKSIGGEPNNTTYVKQKNVSHEKTKTQIKSKIKDEVKFFNAFSELIGQDYLLSKSIRKPISASNVFLSDNYIDYNFDDKVNNCYSDILEALGSNKTFTSNSLAHFIDGVVVNHPKLKNRIVEFDEEQHFTPARRDTLVFLKEILPDAYLTLCQNICDDISYLNKYVLKKHRIKNSLKSIPKSFSYFVKWLELSGEKPSGYIENKNSFDFIGGRIAQRAYYDCLRDTAHLSVKNISLEPPLRFAKKSFEDITKEDFNSISPERAKEIIIAQLSDIYGIKF